MNCTVPFMSVWKDQRLKVMLSCSLCSMLATDLWDLEGTVSTALLKVNTLISEINESEGKGYFLFSALVLTWKTMSTVDFSARKPNALSGGP